MFVHQTHLPHLLRPEHYCTQEQLDLETERMLLPAWHCIGSVDDIPNDGDFMTREVLGYPLLVRREAGELHCFLNVCSHRHCALTDLARGHQERITCQYHGWEYACDGTTRKIPDAKSFRPFPREQASLKKYRVETVAQLVFVCLSDETPPVREWLGPVAPMIDEWFGATWRQYWENEPVFESNWKIPIENALESYHINMVHKSTLGQYPTEETCTHDLCDTYTAFHTVGGRDNLQFATRLEARAIKLTGREPNFTYNHVHVFPNLLLSSSELFTAVQTVLPLGTGRHRSIWRMFAWGGPAANRASRIGWHAWARWGRGFWPKVTLEDASILEAVHRGMEAPHHPAGGMIATREERIWQFQRHVLERTGDGEPIPAPTTESDEVPVAT